MSIGLIMFLELTNGFKWVGLAYAILSFLVFIEVMILALFHCYISFCLYKTTLQVLRGDKEERDKQTPQLENISTASPVAIHPSPLIEDRVK